MPLRLRLVPPTHRSTTDAFVSLEPVDRGCVLQLSHFVTDTARSIDNCYVVDLHPSLARLEPCLAGRPAAWDWDVFAQAHAHYASMGVARPGHAS
jgi:hypothetical protein